MGLELVKEAARHEVFLCVLSMMGHPEHNKIRACCSR